MKAYAKFSAHPKRGWACCFSQSALEDAGSDARCGDVTASCHSRKVMEAGSDAGSGWLEVRDVCRIRSAQASSQPRVLPGVVAISGCPVPIVEGMNCSGPTSGTWAEPTQRWAYMSDNATCSSAGAGGRSRRGFSFMTHAPQLGNE
jgi:hypothetical protein